MKSLPAIVVCCLAQCLAGFAATAPAGFWQFENPPGFLEDSSGNGGALANDGGVSAAAAISASGQAAAFSGSNRLTVADSPAWSSPQLTVEAYFKLAAVNTGATQVIVSHHNNTGNQRGWHFAEAGGKLRFAKSTDGSGLATSNAFTLVAGRNYYAAAILDATAGNILLVLKDLTAGSAPQTQSEPIVTGLFDAGSALAIGSTGTTPAGSSFFKGTIDNVRFTAAALGTQDLLEPFAAPPIIPANPIVRSKADGYKGLWFTLGQFSEYGDKYSGGLAAYTVNHRPIAIYSAAVNKTFFTYGGTTGPADRHLLIMAGEYDHATHTVTKPTIVMDKNGVDDPHDNACLSIDKDGYIWVFVSGRNTARKGFTYRSAEPYSVDGFSRISPVAGENYTYPQVWYDPAKGFFHLLTQYNGSMRELFYRTSADGLTWSAIKPLAKIQGHYQVSGRNGNTIATFFNRHPNGNVDQRTDLYYAQTTDWGQTWTTADGTPLTLPLTTTVNPARVVDYASKGLLMYGIDIAFDAAGHPVLYYLTSRNHQPGPAGEPRIFHTARWTGSAWEIRDLPTSATPLSGATHNYASGSLWIENGVWNITAPTTADPALKISTPKRYWGQGGELDRWRSSDQGATWTKVRAVTENSARNQGFVRHALEGSGRFFNYWADGNPDGITECHLYFGNSEGTRVWELPYSMATETAHPAEVKPAFERWRKINFDAPQLADPLISGPDADPDRDGLSNLIEYAQGSNPRLSGSARAPSVSLLQDDAGSFLDLYYCRNSQAFDLLEKVQVSENLETWQDIEDSLFDISSAENGDVVQRHRGDRSLPQRKFYRLHYQFDP